MKHTVEVMIPEAEIKARIAELGRQITERYKDSGSDMVLVGLLRGSFMFMADLCREVQVSHEVDFMTASSYGSGMSTTRDVKILKDLDEDIRGKDVLSMLTQVTVTFALVCILWVVYGYSLAFGEGNNFFGNINWLMLKNIELTAVMGSIYQYIHVAFQGSFACITV